MGADSEESDIWAFAVGAESERGFNNSAVVADKFWLQEGTGVVGEWDFAIFAFCAVAAVAAGYAGC